MRAINLLNQKFGKLKVISRAKNNKLNQACWNCICDCNKETTVDSHSLRRGSTKSCGCGMFRFKLLPDFLAAKHILYQSYKKACAKKRGYSFNLNFKEFINLTQQNCYYCGISPNRYCKSRNSKFLYNGLDRLNNDLGYEIENVVPCCKNCNTAKSDQSKEDYINWIKKCYNHLNLKEKI
jgi:hypothetical protein